MKTNYTLVRIISILTFIYITRLIYSHKLKVGYSWFLFLLGTGFLILSVWPDAIDFLYLVTGSESWLNNVLFFLVIFLFIIVVHCTIVISALTDRVKELGQQIAISFAEIDEKNLMFCPQTQLLRRNDVQKGGRREAPPPFCTAFRANSCGLGAKH